MHTPKLWLLWLGTLASPRDSWLTTSVLQDHPQVTDSTDHLPSRPRPSDTAPLSPLSLPDHLPAPEGSYASLPWLLSWAWAAYESSVHWQMPNPSDMNICLLSDVRLTYILCEGDWRHLDESQSNRQAREDQIVTGAMKKTWKPLG